MLRWQTAELLKIEIARDRYTVYVEPKIVVEIAFNEIQVSPRYKSGLALRFARVKRYRHGQIGRRFRHVPDRAENGRRDRRVAENISPASCSPAESRVR